MPRHLVFRFDVDTHRCLTRGTPALRTLAAEFGVAFTFFVNMGRATSRHRVIAQGSRPDRSDRAVDRAVDRVERLSSVRKLGVADTMRIVVRNPLVGGAHVGELATLRDAGHELGLHGGRNHRQWQDRARDWRRETVAAEVAWGMHALAGAVTGPVGFASPAWQQPHELPSVAAELGIAYLADEHGHDRDGVTVVDGVPSVATNILGEPGGVGFLEWHRARGSDDGAIVDDFRRRLERITEVAVMYDHPFWAGVGDLEMTATLLREARAAGVDVVTLGQAVAARTVNRPDR